MRERKKSLTGMSAAPYSDRESRKRAAKPPPPPMGALEVQFSQLLYIVLNISRAARAQRLNFDRNTIKYTKIFRALRAQNKHFVVLKYKDRIPDRDRVRARSGTGTGCMYRVRDRLTGPATGSRNLRAARAKHIFFHC